MNIHASQDIRRRLIVSAIRGITSLKSMMMNLGWPEGLWYGMMIFWFDSRLLEVRSRQCT